MERRQFLIGAALTMLEVVLRPNLVLQNLAEAAPAPLQLPQITETNLTFQFPLQSRIKTTMIIFHHIGGTNQDVSAAQVHQWHLDKGWAGIGYHYVIRKNGRIERGRPLDAIGAHCYGYNPCSVGINLVGDFDTDIPTEAQMASAKLLTAFLCNYYRLNPTVNKVIWGHRDLNSTECPGNNLYCKLGDIQKYSQQRIFS